MKKLNYRKIKFCSALSALTLMVPTLAHAGDDLNMHFRQGIKKSSTDVPLYSTQFGLNATTEGLTENELTQRDKLKGLVSKESTRVGSTSVDVILDKPLDGSMRIRKLDIQGYSGSRTTSVDGAGDKSVRTSLAPSNSYISRVLIESDDSTRTGMYMLGQSLRFESSDRVLSEGESSPHVLAEGKKVSTTATVGAGNAYYTNREDQAKKAFVVGRVEHSRSDCANLGKSDYMLCAGLDGVMNVGSLLSMGVDGKVAAAKKVYDKSRQRKLGYMYIGAEAGGSLAAPLLDTQSTRAESHVQGVLGFTAY